MCRTKFTQQEPSFLKRQDEAQATFCYNLQVTSVLLVSTMCQNFLHLFQNSWHKTQVAINALHCTFFKVLSISTHLQQEKKS